MQKASRGLFRSKQTSDTSRQNENKRQSYRSYASDSPLNSPVAKVSGLGASPASPASLPGASTPTSIGDTAQGFDRRDYVVEEQDKQDIKKQEQEPYRAHDTGNNNNNNHPNKNKSPVPLGRTQSQRSPPTTFSAGRGASPLTSPEVNIGQNSASATASAHQSSTVKSFKSDQKKKRRFWNWGDNKGLGLSSSSASTQGDPSRSPPTAIDPAGSSAAPHPKVLTKRRGNPRNQSFSRPSPDQAPEEEEPTTTSKAAAKARQRHSVIGLPIQTGRREGSVSSRDDLSQTKFYSGSTFTTASSQAQGEAGSQRTPAAWERPGRIQHQRTASTDESYAILAGTSAQKSRLEPNYSDQHYSNSRPPSRQSVDPPSPSEASYTLSHQRTTSSQNSSIVKGYMGSQNNQQQSIARNAEGQANSNSREGQYGSTLSVNNQQLPSYRNTPQASPMVQENSNSGQGRSTPPPGSGGNKSREDLAGLDVQQLLSRHEELNDKYRKVKKYYFDKDAQVQQLQNTLAHQRLSQSRTSLDDNEYATRFSRLDGAINNLAFNIRKDWKAVPLWLAPCVNKDATTAVTKEMTAVGRACISRWLVDEVFDRYFHPGLEPHLSSQLKLIERNLRRFAPPTNTDEEKESLLAKISNWRLSTLDGLQDMLSSNDSTEYRTALTKLLVDMLTQDLKDNLKEPAPPGLDAGVIGIIELAVGVAANLPFESRDVYVDYIMPGTVVNDSYMKVEAALPTLTNPGDGPPDGDRQSLGSADDEDEQKEQKGGKTKGVLSNLMGANKKAGSRGNDSQSSVPKEDRVRFAAFMSVEVKGRNILIKAPVYV